DAAGKARIQREERGHLVSVEIEHADLRAAAGAGAGDDLEAAVAVHVARGDGDAAGEALIVGEVLLQEGAVLAAENADLGPAAGAGAADHVVETVAVDVAGRDVDAAREAGIEGEEIVEGGKILAADDADARPTAGAGGAQNVADAVVIHVADGHVDAAGEVLIEGEELVQQIAAVAVEDVDL